MTPKELSEHLRAWRERMGITAAEAAELLEISASTYRNAEYERGFPYTKLLLIACETLEKRQRRR